MTINIKENGMTAQGEAKQIIEGSKRDAERFYREQWSATLTTIMEQILSSAMMSERGRFISIVKSIEVRNEAEARLMQTIIERVRGDA